MKFLLWPLVLLLLTACATRVEKEKIRQKAQGSEVSDSKSLGLKVKRLVQSSTTLSDTQKLELEKLFEDNKKIIDALTEESYKFRGLLVKKLLSGHAKKKDINFLKKEIERIERKRLKNTFDTLEKISKIVADQPDHDEYSDPLMHMQKSFR
jgi:Rad3-related DNA helicase